VANSFRSAVFSPDGTKLRVCDRFGLVRDWSVESGEILRSYNPVPDIKLDPINYVLSPDFRTVACNFGQEGHWLISVSTRDKSRVRGGQAFGSQSFSADGQLMAVCDEDFVIRVIDVKTNKATLELKLERRSDLRRPKPTISPNGKFLAVGTNTSGQLFSLGSDRKSAKLIKNLSDGAVPACFSADSRMLALLGKTDQILDLKTLEVACVLRGSSGIACASFSPDGRSLVTGSRDLKVILWDVISGEELFVISSHSVPQELVLFSPTGSALASCAGGSWQDMQITLHRVSGGAHE
jgi:WD40 repeat protein